MNDNALFTLIGQVLTAGFKVAGLQDVNLPAFSVAGSNIVQAYQPVQEGINTGPTVYLYKIGNDLLGMPSKATQWNPDVSAEFTATIAGTTMDVSAVADGTLKIGQAITGDGIPTNTFILALGTGTGGIGTYTLNQSLTVASEDMEAIPGLLTLYTQQMLTRFQLSALVTQDPANATQITASDVVNYASFALQADAAINSFRDSGVGILKVATVSNPYFVDDRERYEASPALIFTLSHKQQIISFIPQVQGQAIRILPV